MIQPGLAGLMDGSVSILAPLFAAAFATKNSVETLRVGLAASRGAGISMGFAEALSDDGSLTGRGRPWTRGLMTALGGLGHTLPYRASSSVMTFLEVIAYLRTENRILKEKLGKPRILLSDDQRRRPASWAVVHRTY